MKPHSDATLRDRGIADLLLRFFPWPRLDRPARIVVAVAALYAALLLATPWLIREGPAVMSPAVPAFTQAAEDGRATLHAAAVKARPAIVMRSERAPAAKP
ncbi:MAG: hypothetical protein ACM3QY_01130 [Candidatus Levyibacteriota bacterium]